MEVEDDPQINIVVLPPSHHGGEEVTEQHRIHTPHAEAGTEADSETGEAEVPTMKSPGGTVTAQDGMVYQYQFSKMTKKDRRALKEEATEWLKGEIEKNRFHGTEMTTDMRKGLWNFLREIKGVDIKYNTVRDWNLLNPQPASSSKKRESMESVRSLNDDSHDGPVSDLDATSAVLVKIQDRYHALQRSRSQQGDAFLQQIETLISQLRSPPTADALNIPPRAKRARGGDEVDGEYGAAGATSMTSEGLLHNHPRDSELV